MNVQCALSIEFSLFVTLASLKIWFHRYYNFISVQYAEFLEQEKNDVVNADSLYSKVLKRDPTNELALLRHQINLPQVKAIDMQHYKACLLYTSPSPRD